MSGPAVVDGAIAEAERLAAVWLAWHREMNHAVAHGAPFVRRPPFQWSRDFLRGWAAACADFTFASSKEPMPPGYDDPPSTAYGLAGWLAFAAIDACEASC